MKAYINFFKLRIITNLQYRVAALAGISTQLFFGITYMMLYLAIYESNSSASVPMDLESLITYVWLGQAFFAVIYPFLKDQELLGMIQNGNLAYELIRPQSFYLKFYIKMISERLASAALRCLPIIIVGFLLPKPYGLSLPASFENFILFVLSLFLSCLLVSALSMLVHIITLYTIDSRGVISAYSVVADVFMGGVIPVPFLPKFMIRIGEFLPFRFIGDFPYRVYSGNISVIEGRTLLLGSILWIIITMVFGFLLSNAALKKAVIQGG